MRALSIRQPWAHLIMVGLKKIETRSARTKRRGTVLIHASLSMGAFEREAAIREGLDPDTLVRGAILGSVDIVDAKPVEELSPSREERQRGDYGPGRWGWLLAGQRRLSEPIPCTGALSFWSPPVDALAEVKEHLDLGGDLVFVYGTLKRGHGNHGVLKQAAFEGRDCIGGAMYDLGGFPAADLSSPGTIHGEVYQVDEAILQHLDRLEGTPSFYQRTRVRMSSGRWAWVYVMRGSRLASRSKIPSGRWERRH